MHGSSKVATLKALVVAANARQRPTEKPTEFPTYNSLVLKRYCAARLAEHPAGELALTRYASEGCRAVPSSPDRGGRHESEDCSRVKRGGAENSRMLSIDEWPEWKANISTKYCAMKPKSVAAKNPTSYEPTFSRSRTQDLR